MGAFLLVTPLIASAITAAVLRRRKRRKELVPVEGTEEPEVVGISLTPTTSKQQENIEASGEREDLHCRSTDALGQSCHSMITAVRSVGDYYDIIDVPSQEGTGPQCNHTKDHCDDQPKGDPNAVYAVVDKSKKKKHEKTQGGASATTTQGADIEEQHYEHSGFGQDWFGTAVEVNPEATLTNAGCSSTNTETNDPQSEPYNVNPNALYAVVDKSKKRRKVSAKDASSSLTTAHVDASESQKRNTDQGPHVESFTQENDSK